MKQKFLNQWGFSGVILLGLFLTQSALAQMPPGGTNLWIRLDGITSGSMVGIISNSIADVTLELQSKTNLLQTNDWSSEGFLFGDETTNWTPWSLSVTGRTNANFFVRVRSWIDSQGIGIPDWWQLKYFGYVGIDPFADPDGDGYNNLEEYLNGTNPTVFNSPPKGVSNVQAITSNTTNVTVSWQTSTSTNVTSYTVTRASGTNVTTYTVSGGTTSFTDTNAPTGSTYTVAANYPSGSSPASTIADPSYNSVLAIDPEIVRGANPSDSSLTPLKIVLGGIIPTNITAIRVQKYIAPLYYNYHFGDYDWGLVLDYGDQGWSSDFTGNPYDGYFDVPISSFTNGIYQIPVSQLTEWCAYYFKIQPVGSDGRPGVLTDYIFARNVPFIDGTTVLKDNLSFMMRASQTGDPNYDVSIFDFQSDPNYVAVSPMIQHMDISPDLVAEVAPFNDSWFMKNWQYDGVFAYYGSSSWYFFWLDKNLDPFGGYYQDPSNGYVKYQFDGYTYVNNLTASLLDSQLTNNSFIYLQTSRPNQINSATLLTEAGLSWNGSQTTLASSYANRFGLAYQNVRIVQSQNAPTTKFDIATGGAYSDPIPSDYSEYFQKLAAPSLTTVDYYFAQAGDRTDEEANTLTPMPNDGVFSVTNTTPLIITAVGQPATIYGWAKQSTAASGKYAYLGQYFDPTSATNGILSEYGDFMALQPGQFTLKTKLDGSSQGSCPVYAVSLNVDANHDSTMDLTYTGPDTTSAGTPFVFWVNDDNDGTGTGQEIEVDGKNALPDYSYGAIRSQRGLEDFARLWICGVPSLPSGYTATLSCTALSGSPSINLYVAESGGGLGYLTNSTTASGLIGETKLGTISPANTYTFSSSLFAGSNKYFLFEGVGTNGGEGQFTLTIYQNGNLVAQSSVFIDLRNIKTMYQRAVATPDNFAPPYNQSGSPYTNNVFDESVLSYGQPEDTYAFQQPPDETPQCVVFVHGWNMDYNEFVSFSESMFKRLWWQGYHGRFATFRWATLTSFNSYNTSEFRAWKYGLPFKNYVETLKASLPGYTMNIVAHSMGNVVVGSALHRGLAVNNYVLMQAAIPAGCYDTSSGINSYAPFLAAEANTNNLYHVTPDFANPDMGYRGYLTNVTGNLVNFFNPNDFALATGNLGTLTHLPFLWWIGTSWENNQESFKPDHFNLYTTYYAYFTNAPAGQKGQFQDSTTTVLHYVTDPHEMMSFVARPRSQAVGAKEGIGGRIGSEVDLNANFGFGNQRSEHSAEFNWTLQQLGGLSGFYQTLGQKLQVLPED